MPLCRIAGSWMLAERCVEIAQEWSARVISLQPFWICSRPKWHHADGAGSILLIVDVMQEGEKLSTHMVHSRL